MYASSRIGLIFLVGMSRTLAFCIYTKLAFIEMVNIDCRYVKIKSSMKLFGYDP